MQYNNRRFPRLVVSIALIVIFACGGVRAADAATLYSFCSNFQSPLCLDGASPQSRLLQVGDDFYGTASAGGQAKYQYSPKSKAAYGTLFRISTTGAYQVLYTFCQQTYCDDGATPGNYLTRSSKDDIFGITQGGGKMGAGTIFKLTSGTQYSIVYRFCSRASCADGFQPVSVIFNGGGTLFGTTAAGGAHGAGAVFMITTANVFRVIYSFCSTAGCDDGITPGALVLGDDGNLYGTTAAGGKNQSGTVFRITQKGVLTTLHSFCAEARCADGESPSVALARGRDGNFYGVTTAGGTGFSGTAFRITPAGDWKLLHSFCAAQYCDDGASPADGLVVGKDGGLFGVAGSGGRFYHGLLFHLTPAGGYSVVYQFCGERGCFDGATPQAAPTIGMDGSLYGAALAGGEKYDVGAIYRLKP